jgi:hypothetical protein
LRRLGWTWEQIGIAAGLAPTVAYNIVAGRQHQRVIVDTEQAILSVALAPVESHRGVDATGTRRRMQALAWMGWSTVNLSHRVGLRPATLHTLTYRGTVSTRTARRVAHVYQQLSHLTGPSQQSATKARKAGHAPPMAWDDNTIDDPAAHPDYGAREVHWRRIHLDDVRFFEGVLGMSRQDVARRIGVQPDSITRVMLDATTHQTDYDATRPQVAS